jgi:archaemetzincin
MKNAILLGMIAAIGLGCQPSHQIPAKIGLLRLGKMDEALFAQAKKEIGLFYNAEVVDLGKKAMPQLAYYAPRNRYRADKLIDWLLETRSDSVDFILGLTVSDISHTKGKIEDYGILGLAYCPGRSGVVSSFRVGKGAKNEAQFVERFSKIVLHELGHNFGIEHCANSKLCLMRDACGTVKTLDSEPKTVCEYCRKRLGNLLRN